MVFVAHFPKGVWVFVVAAAVFDLVWFGFFFSQDLRMFLWLVWNLFCRPRCLIITDIVLSLPPYY